MSYMKEALEIFICDECDTLATVLALPNEIQITKCNCLALDWNN